MITLDGTLGITTPSETNTGTLSVTGVTTLTGGLNAALPVLSGGTGVTTSTGSGANVLGTSPTLTTPTFDSASLPTISGTAPLYMCRAWVNFNGTGTVAIRASGNVSRITDLAAGYYQVNFTTVMPDANYSVVANASSNNSAAFGGWIGLYGNVAATATVTAPTTSAFVFSVLQPTQAGYDAIYVNLDVIR